MTLDKLKTGESGIILKISGSGALRCRLLDMGLIQGTVVKKVKAAPFGDPLEITLRGYQLSLRKKEAEKIEIERIN